MRILESLGFDEPRKHSVVGDLSLPSARSVSNAIHLDGEATHVKYTHMVMQFGQFLDHDMTLAPISRGISCFFHCSNYPQVF